MKVQRAIVVTLMLALALVSHLKVLLQSFFYVMARHCYSKALSGELSCMGTDLVKYFMWWARGCHTNCNIVDRRSFGFVGFEPWD